METNRAKRIKTKNCSSYKAFGEGNSKQGIKTKITIYGEKKGHQKAIYKKLVAKKKILNKAGFLRNTA